ncbi:fungal-specific transcription factor domain-containing protein [Aspergillus carlsbadensis]|nr:fungal-specific transcription factor domain-containing protein [Aspergillus carlsbadensis]
MFTSHLPAVSDSNSTTQSPVHDRASISESSTLPSQYLGLSPRHHFTNTTDQAQDGAQLFHIAHEQPSPAESNSKSGYNDPMALRDGTNPITILTEALGSAASERLASNTAMDGEPWMPSKATQSGPNDADTEFLRQKGAFSLPPRHVCDKLLALFFEKVYIAIPILNRAEFVQDYWHQTSSMFVLQSVLASAVPHAPCEFLKEAGFSDRATAQETFFTRAKFLHDFDVEKRMLQRLQGSLILAVTHVSHYMQCDHRFWFSNATCIASRMGLHRYMQHASSDPSTKLLRRIWWLMYTWDVLLALNGMNTMRRFYDADSDVPQLTEDDWEDESLPEGQSMLLPICRFEKLYLIQSCKLSLLISRFWVRLLDSRGPPLSCNELEAAFSSWRHSFPTGEKPTAADNELSSVSSWHLTLQARGYVCECVLYRMMMRRSRRVSNPSESTTKQALYRTLFELDTTIDRVMNQNAGQFSTWLFHTCISTAIALHVERCVNPSTSSFDKVLSTLRIQVMLEFLREMAKSWSYIGCFVTLFEAVIRFTGLAASLPGPPQEPTDPLPSPVSIGLRNGPWKNIAQDISPWPLTVDTSVLFDIPSGPFDANSILDELFSENFEPRAL